MAEAARFLTELCKQKGQAWKCWKTAIPCSPLGCCRSRWKYNGKYICPDAALVLLVNRHRLLPGLSFWPLSWPLTSLLKEKGKFFRKLVYNPNVRVKNPEEGYGFFFFFFYSCTGGEWTPEHFDFLPGFNKCCTPRHPRDCCGLSKPINFLPQNASGTSKCRSRASTHLRRRES